jgi:hypothetical protein
MAVRRCGYPPKTEHPFPGRSTHATTSGTRTRARVAVSGKRPCITSAQLFPGKSPLVLLQCLAREHAFEVPLLSPCRACFGMLILPTVSQVLSMLGSVEGKRVLELGAGIGRFTGWLMRWKSFSHMRPRTPTVHRPAPLPVYPSTSCDETTLKPGRLLYPFTRKPGWLYTLTPISLSGSSPLHPYTSPPVHTSQGVPLPRVPCVHTLHTHASGLVASSY